MANIEDKKLSVQAIVDNPNAIWKSESILRFFLPQFCLLLVFVVSITRFAYYILRPFNQPHFVAEFIAGLVLCPNIISGTIVEKYVLPPKALLGVETMAHVGLIYNVFLTGLEMNLETILLARKKATTIAITGTIIPMALGAVIYSFAQVLFPDLSHYNTTSAYSFWALVLSVTNYPVLAHILGDLKILYTGLGRLAVIAATISDFYNWAMFVLLIPYVTHSKKPYLSVILTIVFVLFCYYVLRPSLNRLINNKTEKNEWNNYKLSYVLVGVLVCAHVTELLGTHSVVGALVFGLILPRGKFTDMLIERSNDMVSLYLAPLFFIGCGVRFNFRTFSPFHKMAIIILFSCCTKIVSTVIVTAFYRMPFRDGFALGALLNTKGLLPLIMLNIASDRGILHVRCYTTLVTSNVVMTVLVPLIINYIYKPRKRFEKKKLRTIEKLRGDAEIRIMACVHNVRQATGMMSIIEAFSPMNNSCSSLRVCGLQLIELKGRGTALLVDQQSQGNNESIGSLFERLVLEQEHFQGRVPGASTIVETLTAVSSYETIHKDIYNIADERQASLILLPFHKHSSVDGTLEVTNSAFKDINQNVMHHAPCSVGILVDRGHDSLSKVNLSLCIVFIGGPDDREALAIAWRMAKHPKIHLSMVHIHLFGNAAEMDKNNTVEDEAHAQVHGMLSTVLDSGNEKELDEEYVSSFRLMAVNNEDSITYGEKEVHSDDDIPMVLNELDRENYDLYILGHGQGRNSLLLSNLMEWTDSPELGVLGDMLASNTFASCSSLLVVQQYGFARINFKPSNNQSNSKKGDIEAFFGKPH